MSKIFAAALAFVSFLVLSGFAARADTIVQIRDEPGRNPYQAVATISASCSFNGCPATFPATPAGARVVMEYVSCAIILPPGVSPMSVSVGWVGSAVQAFAPAVYQASNNSNISSYTVSSPIVLYVPAGATPQIEVLSNGNAGSSPGECLLSGYRVALP